MSLITGTASLPKRIYTGPSWSSAALTAAFASTSSEGFITTIPGIVRISARSSQHWCVAPSSPTEIPACVAPIFTLSFGYPTELRTCSNARPDANIANELTKGILPVVASPAAIPIMLHSAMPQSICLSGYSFLNTPVFVAAARSASSTTRFGYESASSFKALP